MHPAPYPTPRPLALHLVHGLWVASCPDCGHELGRSRGQAQAEHAGQRHRCPVCHPDHPDAPLPADEDWVPLPRYRLPDHPERQAPLDDLVEWIAANGGFDPRGGAVVKLVRDRVPELAAATGQPGSFHQADAAEFGRRLRAKLLEEAGEAANASPATLVEELGDVLQVLYALAATAGLAAAEIEAARVRKARTHGTYTRRILWQPAPGPAAPSPRRPR